MDEAKVRKAVTNAIGRRFITTVYGRLELVRLDLDMKNGVALFNIDGIQKRREFSIQYNAQKGARYLHIGSSKLKLRGI